METALSFSRIKAGFHISQFDFHISYSVGISRISGSNLTYDNSEHFI